MPETDGISLVKDALEIDPHLVGIVMTGQGTVQSAVEAMKTGAFDYLLKPFKISTILPAISRAMEVRRLKLENIQLKETVAMYELGKTIFYSLDFNTILNKVADAALAQCDADEVSIVLPLREENQFYVALSRGRKDKALLGERIPADRGPLGWVVANRQPLVLSGTIDDTNIMPCHPRNEIVSAISIPMLVGGNLIGVLNINATRPRRPFSLGEVKALNIIMSIAAPTLYGMRLLKDVREAEKKYRSIFENAIEGIFQTTPDGCFLAANSAIARMLNYSSPEELMKSVTDIGAELYVDPEDRRRFVMTLEERGVVEALETQLSRKDGQKIWVSIYARVVKDRKGKITHYEGTLENITEQRRAKEALKESEERYRSLFDTSPDAILLADADGRMIAANYHAEALGLFSSADEIAGSVMSDFIVTDRRNQDKLPPPLEELMERRFVNCREVRMAKKDGAVFPAEFSGSVVMDRDGNPRYVIGVVRDITERKEAEEAVRESEEKLKKVLYGSPIPQFFISKDHRVVYWNGAMEKYSGIMADEIVGTKDHWRAFYDKERPCLADLLVDGLFEEIPKWYKGNCRSSRFVDGGFEVVEFFPALVMKESWLHVTAVAVKDYAGNVIGALETCEDITERILAEEAIRASEEKYRNIFENAGEGIFQTTPEGRFISVNPALARMLGYDTPEELIKRIADLSAQGYVNLEDRTRFKKILEESDVIEGFETQHYRKDGSIIWISINARAVRDSTGKMLYYEGTLQEITGRKAAVEALKRSAEKLRESLLGTIKAISMMVETRDPYTSGHQRKVSSLARVIAQDMALPDDTIDNIRMAGIIHDIGKISVPAEILSKPGKLSDLEFSLIKIHPQSGYDILEDVGLPYPIAEIVLQHHERLDGSGYPQGLKGDQILLEARIIAVTDVVEAIASHRPYRPALGIEIALGEIEKNRGLFYDAGVVDVCIKLFREKGFTFE
jgi:PAS domain S-box-containing protein